MRADELRAGCAEFEMPLGHATCQAVGYMSRKLRGEAVKTMPPLGARNQRQLWRHQYQRAEERQESPQKPQKKEKEKEKENKLVLPEPLVLPQGTAK